MPPTPAALAMGNAAQVRSESLSQGLWNSAAGDAVSETTDYHPYLMSARSLRLRLPFLHKHPLVSVLILSLLAIAANQVGFDLFYGARFYLGSAVLVLALLLLGSRGVIVGVASVLLAPRLWSGPQAAIVLLVEALCLAIYLHGAGNLQAGNRSERRERGDVVFADVLFWIVVAIPLDFLLFGVIANVDLSKVLDLSLLQAINGSCNAALGYATFMIIRVVQSRRDPDRRLSLQGLILISLLGLTLLSSLFSLSVSMRQLDRELIDEQLARFRQVALTSAVLELESLDDLAGLRQQRDAPLDFQVLDAEGRILYNSNPPLFQTLQAYYIEPSTPVPQQPQVAEPLDLLIPLESQDSSMSGLRGYWRYETKDDRTAAALPAPSQQRVVVVVAPARSGIRELQSQSSLAIRQLGLVVLLATVASRSISRYVVRQLPDLSAGDGLQLDSARPAASLAATFQPPDRLHSGLSELQPMLEALRRRGELLVSLRESFRRSERQRLRLEAEVGRLNITDPLTGCFNRRELYRRLVHELRLSVREGRELSFLCLEIDHLRQIHDSYGKSVHEEVLRRIALELRNRSRSTDVLSRLGPEQFGLLLPACDAASASKVAELLSDVIRNLEIRHEGLILSVTLSVGVALMHSGRDDPDALISRAQNALYRAKAEGRDRVVVA